MKILICSFIDNDVLCEQTAKLVNAVQIFGGDIDILCIGHNINESIKNNSFQGIKSHIIADNPKYLAGNAEYIADLLLHIAKSYDVVIAPSTTIWKNILPRFAALCDIMMMSDVIKIDDINTYHRPIYAGNAIAKISNMQSKKIMTLRTASFQPMNHAPLQGDVILSDFVPEQLHHTTFISQELSKNDRPELTSAKIVVSGGRGVGSADNFKIIYDFADILGAAVGASRAAVDAGYVPNDYQVGQTGKIIAPDIYIAIGISGAIQHLAGMKDSKTIIAINKDPDAPIFSVADYGIVGDLFDIIPQLIQEIKP